jgi:hypothetical protein
VLVRWYLVKLVTVCGVALDIWIWRRYQLVGRNNETHPAHSVQRDESATIQRSFKSSSATQKNGVNDPLQFQKLA